MNKSIKILRFAALALAVVTALGVGRAYAGIAIPVGPAADSLPIECFYCRHDSIGVASQLRCSQLIGVILPSPA